MNPSPASDDLDAVVRRAQAGEAEAFDALVLHLQRPVRLVVAARSCDALQIDEVVQGTWVRVYEQLDRYEPRGTFQAWVCAIARNVLREDLQQRRRGRFAGGSDLLDRLAAEDCLGGLAEAENNEDDERLRRLPGCLDRLAPRARQMLEARDRDGLALADLAERFRQSAGTLATLLWRIRRDLRQCLEQRA